jgi:hypothetical protein
MQIQAHFIAAGTIPSISNSILPAVFSDVLS